MKKIFLALALWASSFPCFSAQVLLQDSPAETATAIVSRHEPNLITVNGRKIRRIFGAEGLFTVSPEPDTGAAWVKPTTDKPMFTIYVTDEDGQHYKVLLKVEDVPSETVVLQGRGVNNPALSQKNEPRNDDIINTTMSMYSGDGDVKEETIPLWKGTKFQLKREVDLHGIRGEAYLLTNTSSKQMVMTEQEFYRKGVESITIEKPILDPGQSTRIFIITEDDE